MLNPDKLCFAFAAFTWLASPGLIYAEAPGPAPGLAGVPGELGTCADCHGSGASSINTKGGSVKIAFPNGSTYVPGQAVISAGGVVNGASFDPNIEAGSWVTIRGSNLTAATSCDPAKPSPGCRAWASADFTNGTPTSLDGVSVTLGDKAAYVYYISPTQINVQAPDIGTGNVDVTVTNSNGTSNVESATAGDCAPGFFQAGYYAIATHQDGTLVAPSGTFPGSSPARPSETVILWGPGFGPVSPLVPAAALNPSALGLYQIAVTVPASATSGDQAIIASVGGKSSPSSGVLFSVQ